MSLTSEELIAALRERGLRITSARRAVCAAVAEAGGEHLTAADVHERARVHRGADLDRSTVYRTLETLEEAGLIRHGHLGHGPAVYHLGEEDSHQHLVCSNCGRTIAMAGRDMDQIVDLIRRRTGFEVDVDHFALVGFCDHCRP